MDIHLHASIYIADDASKDRPSQRRLTLQTLQPVSAGDSEVEEKDTSKMSRKSSGESERGEREAVIRGSVLNPRLANMKHLPQWLAPDGGNT